MSEPSSAAVKTIRNSSGILYLAARSYKFILDAGLSALSCREVGYDGPIALFTDLPLPGTPPDDLFDDIRATGHTIDYGDRWVTGKFQKLYALQNTPYARTLYMDTDTRILNAGIREFPRLLFAADMAMTRVSPQNSFCARALNTDVYNAGVIAYRKTPAVLDLLHTWQALTESHHQQLQAPVPVLPDILKSIEDPSLQKQLLKMDQIGLYTLLNPQLTPAGIRFQEMGVVWNHRQESLKGYAETIVHHHKIHRRHLKAKTQDAINLLRHRNSPAASWLQAVLALWRQEKETA